MKYIAALALLASVQAEPLTITVNEETVGGIVGKWAQTAMDMEQFANSQWVAEQQELQPYVDSMMQSVMAAKEIDDRYNEAAIEKSIEGMEQAFNDLYRGFGCNENFGPGAGQVPRRCQHTNYFLGNIPDAFFLCECQSVPVSVTDAREMQCMTSTTTGKYSCMYI